MRQKNRYIVAFYALKSRPGAPTHIKGYMDRPNMMQWDESFFIREGLRKNDLIKAQVILDLDEKKIVKNWKANEGENDFDALYSYYDKNYSKYISNFMKASDRGREKKT